jgi:hypothetical protein
MTTNSVFCFLLACATNPSLLLAQQAWDEMDVIDGPNPTLRYGFYTEPSGVVQMGRYYFIDNGSDLRVRLVPYGKTATELPVLIFDRDAGKLDLGWEGRPDRRCHLNRNGDDLFLGNCLEGESVMPIAIRRADRRDAEWMGSGFPVSQTDIDIVDRAIEILTAQGVRNPEGDRNCDDDIEMNRMSIFCALYAASIDVDGVYRHRRLRHELIDEFPGDYAHLLRDINNRSDIPDEALIGSFESARSKLLLELAALQE